MEERTAGSREDVTLQRRQGHGAAGGGRIEGSAYNLQASRVATDQSGGIWSPGRPGSASSAVAGDPRGVRVMGGGPVRGQSGDFSGGSSRALPEGTKVRAESNRLQFPVEDGRARHVPV